MVALEKSRQLQWGKGKEKIFINLDWGNERKSPNKAQPIARGWSNSLF